MSTRSDDNKTLVKTIKRYIKSGLFEKIDQITEKNNKTVISILSKRNGLSLIIFMKKHETYSLSLLKYIFMKGLFVKGYDIIGYIHILLEIMCKKGNLEVVKFLLSEEMKRLYPRINPSVRNNVPIIRACYRGRIEVVKFLLSNEIRMRFPKAHIDPSAENNFSIQSASRHGHIEVVKFLLSDEIHALYPRIDPSTCRNYAIRQAIANGHIEVVKFLLSDDIRKKFPSALVDWRLNNIIMTACKEGRLDIVKFLLEDEIRMRFPNIDPSADNNAAIMNAILGNHVEVVKFLLIYSEEMRELYPNDHIDPAPPENLDFLRNACFFGEIEVIKFLFSDEIMMLYPSIDPIKLLENGCYNNFSREILKILLDNKKTIENGGIIIAERSYRGDKIQDVIREIKNKHSILSI